MGRTSARIFAILARDAPVGVILRRGPSKQVALIKWNLRNDKLQVGQWFKGRIYERRCDLSPDGEQFIYFAANYKQPLYSWTAISEPPYLKATALWPKGDGWGGGGMFDSNLSIKLNHPVGQDKLAEGFKLKKHMRVGPCFEYSGRGEDFPIYHYLLERDGWKQIAKGEFDPKEFANATWSYHYGMRYEKLSKDKEYCLRMRIKGVHQKNDSWYRIDYDLINSKGEILLELPHTDWADWDSDDDLLFAKEGQLFRIKKKKLLTIQKTGADTYTLIADLRDLKFEAKAAPY